MRSECDRDRCRPARDHREVEGGRTQDTGVQPHPVGPQVPRRTAGVQAGHVRVGGVVQVDRSGHPHQVRGRPVPLMRALADHRDEAPGECGRLDDAEHRRPFEAQRHRDAPVGQTREEVRRPVDRVEHPRPVRPRCDVIALLADRAMTGERGEQTRHQPLVGLAVVDGDRGPVLLHRDLGAPGHREQVAADTVEQVVEDDPGARDDRARRRVRVPGSEAVDRRRAAHRAASSTVTPSVGGSDRGSVPTART